MRTDKRKLGKLVKKSLRDYLPVRLLFGKAICQMACHVTGYWKQYTTSLYRQFRRYKHSHRGPCCGLSHDKFKIKKAFNDTCFRDHKTHIEISKLKATLIWASAEMKTGTNKGIHFWLIARLRSHCFSCSFLKETLILLWLLRVFFMMQSRSLNFRL